MRPNLIVTIGIDVEEEGLFSGRYGCVSPSVANTQHLLRLQPIMDMGAVPVLFCAYNIFTDTKSRQLLDRLRNKYKIEIGAHLHHWNTPPIEDKNKTYITNPSSIIIQPIIMEEKLKCLLNIARDFCGYPVISFRMGRWDLHKEHWAMLSRNGILCDASIRPLHYSVSPQKGPDHFDAPFEPYWIQVEGAKILEIPHTVVPILKEYRPKNKTLRENFKNLGCLPLLAVQHPLWLMKLCTLLHVRRGGTVISLSWHSSEMMPGGTPHISTEDSVKNFLNKICSYLQWLQDSFSITWTSTSNLMSIKGSDAPICSNINGDWAN